jgi:hypothetical protein
MAHIRHATLEDAAALLELARELATSFAVEDASPIVQIDITSAQTTETVIQTIKSD